MASVGTTVNPDLRTGPLTLGLAALATAALWPSLASLIKFWGEIHDYRHGYVIAAVSAIWLVFVARRQWSLRPQPSLPGLAALAAVLFAWVVGVGANSLIAHQMLLPLAVWCAVWSATGLRQARHAAAPIAFLYFATPVWEYAVPLLQRLSVGATESALGWLGVSAEVHETFVSIRGGVFHIAEGCSGKRYFIVTLAVAVLAAAIYRMRGVRALLYVLACGVLALVANWIRIIIVIYAGHIAGMQTYLVAVEHKTLGNVIFVCLLVLVLFLARVVAPVHAALRPWARDEFRSAEVRGGRAWPVAAMAAALLVAAFAAAQPRNADALHRVSPGGLPLATGRWQGPLPGTPAWAPTYVGAIGERRASYTSGTRTVELYVNVYGVQRQGRELVQYANTLLAPGAWQRSWPPGTEPLSPRTPSPASFEARSDDGTRWLLAYLFDVGGWYTSREPIAQFAYGLQAIRRPVAAGVVALAVRCDTDCAGARALATAFWDDMSGPILGMLPHSGQDR